MSQTTLQSEDGGRGGLGDLLPVDGSGTPLQAPQTASAKINTGAAGGTSHIQREVEGDDGDTGGKGREVEGEGGEVGGEKRERREEDSSGAGKKDLVAQKSARKGKGSVAKVPWTDEERRALYECYLRGGGEKSLGYVDRAKELFDRRNFMPRSKPSIQSQLRTILNGGGISADARDEVEKILRLETLQEEGEMEPRNEVIEVDEVRGVLSFEDGDIENGRQEGDALEAIEEPVEVDFAAEVVMEDPVDTWRETDGTVRALSTTEKEVLAQLREVQGSGSWEKVPSLRAVERKKVMKEVELVDGVLHNLIRRGMDVTEVNRILYSGGVVVAQRLGLKIGAGKKAEEKKPWWQRRIERSIKVWRKDLGRVEEIRKGAKVGTKVREELERRYQLVDRGALAVSAFLKNKIHAGSTKIRWYIEKKVSLRQNNLFRNNQSQLYKELGGSMRTNEAPDAAGSQEFWSNIWSVEVEHDKEASWLGDIRKKMERVRAQEDIVITIEYVRAGVRRMANWKAPGPDGVMGFWFKKLPAVHEAMTEALQECVERGEVPAWMVKGRTVLIQKDPVKGRAVSNYRPIACLPLMWKLLTSIFADKIYDHLKENDLLPDEQKGCRRNSRGTKDQLLIDKAVLREARVKQRCLAMAWIDYKKAYDMLPHSWILETLRTTKVAENVNRLLKGSMQNWKTVLTANGETLGEVDIKRGIFQGDSLSPLLFIIAMIPLTMKLRREKLGYRFGSEGKRLNHLLFMDDLKLYGTTKKDLEKLLEAVRVFSRDIRMEFGLDKCAVLVIKKGQKVECQGIELPDGQQIKEVDENGYKYLGVLEGANIKTREMKEAVRKEYLRRVKLVARSRLYAGNIVRAVNVWAVSVVRYTAGVLEWSDKELKAMDVKTRKILTMNGALHKHSSVDRLYMKRKEGGRGLISVRQCVKAEEIGLCEYVKASDEWMLKVVAEEMALGESKLEYGKRMARERSERLRAKKLHGKFFNEIEQVADKERSWQWLNGGYLDKRTEGFACAAQENALKTKCLAATVYGEGDDKTCRMCGEGVETVGHLISACTVMAQREYRRRHDKMGLRIYWELCGKYGIDRRERWFEETPDAVRVRKDGKVEIWWDKKVTTATVTEHNRPDVVVIDREKKIWTLVDFSVPFDANVIIKDDEKITRYEKLRSAISREYGVTARVIPIIVGALGVVSKRLAGYLKRLDIPDVIGGLQTSAIIGTSAILRKVLNT